MGNITLHGAQKLAQRHLYGQIADWEFVNEVFKPMEQINEAQCALLYGMVELATGGTAQPHIGTGGGGPQSETGWDGKKKRKGEQQGGGFHR